MRVLVLLSGLLVVVFGAYEWNAMQAPVELPGAASAASTTGTASQALHPAAVLARAEAEKTGTEADPELVAECEKSLPPTEIVVAAQPAPVTEVNNEDIRTLTATQQSFSKGHFTMGLTTEAYSLSVETKLNTLTMSKGKEACLRPSLHVTLSEPYHKVSIAREFAPGTCIFNEIRTHEYRHVAVHQNSLEWARGVIEQEMKSQFGNRIYYGDPQQYKQQIEDAVNTYWLPRAQQLHAEVEKQQLEIDTPQEYDRLSQVCDGAAAQIIANTPNLDDLRN
jgi:hypothetical protein